jgi:hypothetical protein
MYRIPGFVISVCITIFVNPSILSQPETYPLQDLQEDFLQFREILEHEHCCLYEFTPKALMDSMFDAHYRMIRDGMKPEEFFMLLAPITAKIGCMHTATWMPGRFFISKPGMMFPLTLKLVDNQVVVTGSYLASGEVPRGSIMLEINGRPVKEIWDRLRRITSADALNPYFTDAQVTNRFSMFYASAYGLPEQYVVSYIPPGHNNPQRKVLTPADHESVRKVVFAHFNHPLPRFEILEEMNAALLTVPTFIYYDRAEDFRNLMDSCFHLIRTRGIEHLVLDVRGNGGGDPFCSSVLLAYLQKRPVPYFAESCGRYHTLSEPLPMPENHFDGQLYTLIDGSCGSTNGHFCALLKYHHIGRLIGTPSGATYKCNAGKNTEFRLEHTQLILTIGRTTYSAAVSNMVKTAILPDIEVHETQDDFLKHRDCFLETALQQIELDGKLNSHDPF